ncbi:MAG TPA: redoxin domain-containing protein [Chitinophagaceae bacterium]|nr:redoxin domain-containing protein [Chitinophagaceae bacterium]
MLTRNDVAPEFEFHATPDQKLALHELKGKNVILSFYPADWSPICGDQISLHNEMLKYFKKYNAELPGISVDSKWCGVNGTPSFYINGSKYNGSYDHDSLYIAIEESMQFA